jgi:hypothetical protein
LQIEKMMCDKYESEADTDSDEWIEIIAKMTKLIFCH